MRASDRRNVLELEGLAMCQCPIPGTHPILWHQEICESRCVRMKSNPDETSGNKLAVFAGEAQPWTETPSSLSGNTKRTASSSGNAWPIFASGLEKEEANAIGERTAVTPSIRQAGTDS
jgi:hypothetical protein